MLPPQVTEHINKAKEEEAKKVMPLNVRQLQQAISNSIVAQSLASPQNNGAQQTNG